MKGIFLHTAKLKAVIALLFLALFILPPILSYSYLQFQKAAVKKEIKHRIIEGIGKEDLVLLSFHKNSAEKELRWEHSKEFEYRGIMYDIVYSSETADSVSYWCWKDDEETSLNRQLALLVERAMNGDNDRKEKTERLGNFFSSLFLPVNTFDFSSDKVNKANFLCACCSKYTFFDKQPPVPPPRFS